MKKPLGLTAILAAALLSAPLFSLSALAADYVAPKKDNVNVRKDPDTKSPVVMEIFSGYPLQIEEKKGDWLRISDYEKDGGWIHASLVDKSSNVIITASKSANMRKDPSTTSPVVAEIERGVVLQLMSSKGKWRQLKHSTGTVGWVHESMVWPQ